MAEDWTADVKKYVPDADEGVIAGIVKYCGIALRNRDSSLVSMTDPTETARVRNNFLKKKLGLTHSDADLNAGIQAVGQRMKGENFKNRVTVYYLLLEHFGKFDLFGGKAVVAVAETAAAAATASNDAAAPQPLAGPHGSAAEADGSSGLGWLWWLLLGLLALALLWWLFFREPGNADAPDASATTEAAAPAA